MCFKLIMNGCALKRYWVFCLIPGTTTPKIDYLLEPVESMLRVHDEVPAPYFKPRKNLLNANMANNHCWWGIKEEHLFTFVDSLFWKGEEKESKTKIGIILFQQQQQRHNQIPISCSHSSDKYAKLLNSLKKQLKQKGMINIPFSHPTSTDVLQEFGPTSAFWGCHSHRHCSTQTIYN